MSSNESVYDVTVHYDDARRMTTACEHDIYISGDRTLWHFPIRGSGTAEVVMTYVTFDHEPTAQEVLAEIERWGLRVPDRAEVESFHDRYPFDWVVRCLRGVRYLRCLAVRPA